MRLSYCGSARWALLLLVLGLLAALCAAQESPSPTGQAATAKPVTDTSPTPDQQPATSGIRLGNGDLISISVYGVPELSQDLRINDEGNVSMALIGSVHVAGLTPEAAQNSIEEKFRSGGFLNNPHVTLLIKEMATQGISVMGEVARPGIYPLMGPRRLYDVIAAAGGLSQRAGQLVTITHRDHPEQPVNIRFSSDPARTPENNVQIMPGDTVVVSKAGLVYVVGDVFQPGGFVMENNENVSVLQAVALAHGPNHTAALSRAKIIRKGSNGLTEIPIPLDKILSAKSPDLPLKAEDIVFVPNSAAKSATRRGLESIVQVATGLAIYRR